MLPGRDDDGRDTPHGVAGRRSGPETSSAAQHASLRGERVIYRLCAPADWARAQALGAFSGGALDAADGFIHCSTRAQTAETWRRHLGADPDTLVLTVDAVALGERVRWEASRGEALFPHVYGGPIACAWVLSVTPIDSFLSPDDLPQADAPGANLSEAGA